MKTSNPITYVCSECGSTDVLLDAFATWNENTQAFEVSNIFDKGHSCNQCGCECTVEEIPRD